MPTDACTPCEGSADMVNVVDSRKAGGGEGGGEGGGGEGGGGGQAVERNVLR
jgi:hypothetical protein